MQHSSECDSGRPLRVLAVTNMYPTRERPTYGRFVQTQMESIGALGVEVGVEVIPGYRGTLEYVRSIGRVRRVASAGKFDLVHAHFGLSGFVCSFQSLPLVISYCGDDLLGTPAPGGGLTAKSRVMVALSRAASWRARGIIAKSEELKRAVPRPARTRCRVIGNGVNTRVFSPGDRMGARQRLGLAADEKIVLFPHPPEMRVKRYDLAAAAVAAWNETTYHGRLLVVGGLTHETLADFYRAADCLLVTSDHEGSPNVVKEALCSGLPVVSVQVGDVEQWIGMSGGGEVVDRSPRAIAAGIQRVVGTPGEVDVSRIRKEVGLESVGLRIIEIYRDVLTSNRVREVAVTGVRA